MREQHLLRGKRTRIVLVNRRAGAEERHLKTERRTVRGLEPSGAVPPSGAEFGMRAVILREEEFDARHDRRIGREPRRVRRRRCGRDESENEKPEAPDHQSSLTAFTASNDSARRPASSAVAAAAAISATVTVANSAYGSLVSIVQLKDCGLTTWIST